MVVGLKRQIPGYRYETVDYDHFQAIFVSRGALLFAVQEKELVVRPGGLLLLRVHSAFTLRCPKVPYEGIGVNLASGLTPAHVGPAQYLVADATIRNLAGWIEAELKAGRLDGGTLAGHLGLALCVLSLRMAEEMGGAGTRGAGASLGRYWAERVRQRIENHLRTGHKVEELMEDLPMGRRQVGRIFRTEFGESLKGYQLRRRIEEAGRMLKGTALSVVEVAMEFGFPSAQHFATQFRRLKGCSPKAFRMGREKEEAPRED